MRRIVWISVALLIMVGIMGYALFTMRNIEKVNKRRHDEDAGKDAAIVIAATTATTSIWDALRATETTTATGSETSADAPAEPTQDGEESPDTAPADGTDVPEDQTEAVSAFEEPVQRSEETTAIKIVLQ